MPILHKRRITTSDEMWRLVTELAERNGRTAAEEVRVALEQHLKVAANVDLSDEPRRRWRKGEA